MPRHLGGRTRNNRAASGAQARAYSTLFEFYLATRARIFPHSKPAGRPESDKRTFPVVDPGPFQKLEFIPQASPGEKEEASYELIDPT
jgi:hypothetical protein